MSRLDSLWSNKCRSLNNISREIRLQLDLDAEEGRPTRMRDGAPANSFRVSVKKAKNDKIRMAAPSKHLINLRRSYFAKREAEKPAGTVSGNGNGNGGPRDDNRRELGWAIEAIKGVYQSIRPAHVSL